MFTANTAHRDTGYFSHPLRALRHAVLGLTATLIAACGGNSMTSVQPSACDDCGTALLTMTDAAGDFLDYTVDVTSLTLKKANGTEVQTLPATSRIDFTELVDLSEVLSAGQIPAGEYVAATLGVDFTHASILVDDGTGTGVQVAPLDAAGHALGAVQIKVELDNRHHLLINRQRVSHLAFDLDLAASNTVNLGAQTVTVSPFVVASVVPPEDRPVRVRGRLDSVDVSGSSYTIDVRPFNAASGSTGQFVVNTTSTTRFEINGAVSTGADGLTQLAALTDHPLTIAFGTIDTTTHTFTAQRVLAATSAEDSRRDYLSGNVLSRSGNTLTVVGSSVERGGPQSSNAGGQDDVGHGPVIVTIGPNTRVTRDGQGSGTMSIADISVGQRVEAYGDLTRDGQGHVNMDATAGRVRLNFTHLFGTVATPTGAGLTLALQNIDGRASGRFNFAGTGTITANDADPAHYQVDTTGLDTTGMTVGAYTRLFGFVTPFGMAPPDFKADTLVDFTDTRAGLQINWGAGGSTAPFSASSATGLTLNLGNGLHGAIQLGGRTIDLATLMAGLQLVPATGSTLTFAIAHRGSHDVENFSIFADFVTQLTADLNGTTPALGIVAEGNFDASGGVFTAKRLLVVLGN